jgi:hypothetical protein
LSTLDCFPKELGELRPKNAWGINIPHWPLEDTFVQGVAGPGMPHEELFNPPELKGRFQRLCGTYDKWRPYPAEAPLSSYNVDIAKRFCRKRCRMFQEVASKMDWDLLFYVEHSPASLAHLSEKIAMEIADVVVSKAIAVARSCPGASLVIFSPYGIGSAPGFAVSNAIDGGKLASWEGIRRYINGEIGEAKAGRKSG